MNPRRTFHAAAAVAGLTLMSAGAQAGWITVTTSGSPVLSKCNPKDANGNQSPTLSTCKIDALPAFRPDGFIVDSSHPQRIGNVVVTGDTGTANVGKLYERVWCHSANGSACDTTRRYIFGIRANLNANSSWNSDGETFEINDIFHVVPTGATVDIAYFVGTVSGGTNVDTAKSKKYLEYAGRTKKGLGEYPGSPAGLNPTRNNGYVDWRADTNAFDPDGISSPWSPWVFARLTCSNGINSAVQPSTIRLHEGGEEDQEDIELYFSGYRCN